MENERTYNINLSNERFISLFDNRIETNQNHNIINYIYNYDDVNRPIYNLPPINTDINILELLRTIYVRNPSQEILLPTFTEQEMLILDDAECGITFESPNCITSCGHYFCRADITRWFEQQKNECKKMTCPTCRTEITSVFVAKNK